MFSVRRIFIGDAVYSVERVRGCDVIQPLHAKTRRRDKLVKSHPRAFFARGLLLFVAEKKQMLARDSLGMTIGSVD